MEGGADWKKICEEEAGGLVDKLKELNNHEKWVANGNKPCDMFKMEVENRLASKGTAVVEFPYEKVIKFFKDPSTSKKINDALIKLDILYAD